MNIVGRWRQAVESIDSCICGSACLRIGWAVGGWLGGVDDLSAAKLALLGGQRRERKAIVAGGMERRICLLTYWESSTLEELSIGPHCHGQFNILI